MENERRFPVYHKPHWTRQIISTSLQLANFPEIIEERRLVVGIALRTISPAVGYTPDVEEYYEWLKKGIENFKK